MVYIYENHLGGMYVTKEEQDYDDLYCEQCGDYDRELFASEDINEIREFLKTNYSLEHCKDIYDECYSKLKEQGYNMY